MLPMIGVSKRSAFWVVIVSFAIESVLLWGLWIAGEFLWDLDSASVTVQVLGHAGIYGHLIIDVLLGWLVQRIEFYPVVLLLYGLLNWIVLALVIGFGCRYVFRKRRNKAVTPS